MVALDDPVHRYIPQWRDLGVYEGGFIGTFHTRRTSAPMRIVDLLRHTSGLTYGFQQRTNVDAAYRKLQPRRRCGGTGTLDAMIEGLAQMPLEFSPGTAWNYSVATDVLGYLIGKISGKPFEEFLRQRILDAAADGRHGFPRAGGQSASRLAACYAATPDGRMKLQDDPERAPSCSAPSFVSAAAAAWSRPHTDYLRFCRMLLNGGTLDGARHPQPEDPRADDRNHLPGGKELPELSVSLFSEATYAGVGFGLGFAVTTNPARTLMPGTVGDFSWGGMASTYFWIDPREELIVDLHDPADALDDVPDPSRAAHARCTRRSPERIRSPETPVAERRSVPRPRAHRRCAA